MTEQPAPARIDAPTRRALPDEDLPDPVSVELTEDVRTYWLDRVRQHTSDTYAGARLSKFPEDLRVYEHLLWASRADVVIEIGAQFGGSALWFRDRLQAMTRYGRVKSALVVSIDISIAAAQQAIADADPSYGDSIKLVCADVRDPELPGRIADMIPGGSSCLVVEDSAHTYDTTLSALTGFARFVTLGGFFVVEDGCVDIDEMRLSDDWPRGVLPAVNQWLGTAEGRKFAVRRDLERYGISCHPHGFLQRTKT